MVLTDRHQVLWLDLERIFQPGPPMMLWGTLTESRIILFFIWRTGGSMRHVRTGSKIHGTTTSRRRRLPWTITNGSGDDPFNSRIRIQIFVEREGYNRDASWCSRWHGCDVRSRDCRVRATIGWRGGGHCCTNFRKMLIERKKMVM